MANKSVSNPQQRPVNVVHDTGNNDSKVHMISQGTQTVTTVKKSSENQSIPDTPEKYNQGIFTVAKDCLFLHGLVEQQPIDWLIDTGAGPNIMNYETFQKIGGEEKFNLQEDKLILTLPNGDALKVYGMVQISVQIGTHLFNIDVTIAEMTKVDAILGIDFLCNNHFSLDFYSGELFYKETVFQMHHNTDSKFCPQNLSESVSVHPGDEIIIQHDDDQFMCTVQADDSPPCDAVDCNLDQYTFYSQEPKTTGWDFPINVRDTFDDYKPSKPPDYKEGPYVWKWYPPDDEQEVSKAWQSVGYGPRAERKPPDSEDNTNGC